MKNSLCILLALSSTFIFGSTKQLIKAARSKHHTSTKSLSFDQIKGMLTLGAYGDAQAGITEFVTDPVLLQFKRPNKPYGYPEIPQLKNLRTQWPYVRFTDDTHMSLYMLHALLGAKDNTPTHVLRDISDNFLNWLHADQAGRAPGNACLNACTYLNSIKNQNIPYLSRWSKGSLESLSIDEPEQGLRKFISDNTGGSGAVMRTSPIFMFFYDRPALAEQLSVGQGIITHLDSGSRAACAGFNATLFAIAQHKTVDQVIQSAIHTALKYDPRQYSQPYNPKIYHYGSSHFSKNGCAAMTEKALEYYKAGITSKPYQEVLDEFRGWSATEALAATLYIFATWNHDPYLAMTVAINRTPGDSDTIAKMVGELFGLQYGYQAIKENFAQYGINLDTELNMLESIQDLTEHPKDFPEFVNRSIKTYNDLAYAIANNTMPKPSTDTVINQDTSHTPEFILTIADMMELPVDCLVNAANSNIQGGLGIDGIITMNINPATKTPFNTPVGDISRKILQELAVFKQLKPVPINDQGKLPVSESVITSSGTIQKQGPKTVKYVISTVGPQGSTANSQKNKELFDCYYNSLLLAGNISNRANNLLSLVNHRYTPIKTVAFPSISTGIFSYPIQQAASMAIQGCLQALQDHPEKFDKIHLVVLSTQSPFPEYKQELVKPMYTKMLKNSSMNSNIALSIETWNNGQRVDKQVIYQPA